MTEIRVLFNALKDLDTEEIFPKVKSLGVDAISVFGQLEWKELPFYFESVAEEFKDVIVNLYHAPTYLNEAGWRESLLEDGKRTIKNLAELGIDNYAWMIECNLFGYSWNGMVGNFVHRNRLADRFDLFYEIAHDVNPDANVIIVPYPHPLMNMDRGLSGWRDWWRDYGEKMRFDQVALNAHVGVWIYGMTDKWVYKRLVDPIRFLQKRGHPVRYVEVGYPTAGYKPLTGGYGWGREEDQVNLLKTCFKALEDTAVPWMQICEFIDPVSKRIYDTPLLGDEGEIPKILGIFPVIEEKHWGLLRADESEKPACEWVRKITGVNKKH